MNHQRTILSPASIEELSRHLVNASAACQRIDRVHLSAINRLLEHKAEDMTATVEAGMTLAKFQEHLKTCGQWLPIDPPHSENITIADLLATNANGPRRFGFGTIRDHLIGLTVVLADGRVIHSGGKVVKNVAGYDLAKLFIGSHHSLGVIVEATFKLRPLPEAENLVQLKCASLGATSQLLEAILNSPITPVICDLYSPATVVLGFAGTKEEVEWQLAEAAKLGIHEPATLDYEKDFWLSRDPAQRLSVLPSKLIENLQRLDTPFITRAGNGIIYHRSTTHSPKQPVPWKLMQRVKNEFDPKSILPELMA